MGRRLLRNLDWRLILLTLFLMVFGLVMIASASRTGTEHWTESAYFRRQLIWIIIALGAMGGTLLVDYSRLRYSARWLYGLNLLLLVLVLVRGATIKGAQSWLTFGPVSFQPAELGKLLIIITLADYIAHLEGRVRSWWDIIRTGLHVLPPVILLLLQPDLGTALVFLAIWLGILFVGGAPLGKLFLLVSGALGAAVAAVVAHLRFGLPLPLKEHQLMRLIVFASPGVDRTGAGYQLIQSLIAVGSGRLLGKGLFMGTQNRLNFLPEQHTDFIFAIVAEELGFAGSLLLLLALFALLWRGMAIAAASKDLFGTLVATGVVSMLAFHILVNVGMTMGMMPITGLPLPFISYGGSSLLANAMGVGLLLNIYLRRHKIPF